MKSYEGTEPYLFVSYAHTDTECIIPILEELDKLGYRFWFDEGIYSGDEWREVVASHLLGSKIVLAFISSDFCESKNCKDEINLAHEHVTIIPVYIDSTENPTYLSAGMLMSLSGYNAIYAGDYFKRSNKIDLIERICNSPDVRICKLMSVGVTKHKECFDSAFLFSKEFLHSGALSIQDHPIEKIKEEVSKLSRLFDSIFYLKHFETRTPSDNIADTIINIIKENIYSFRKNLLKIKGPLGSYKNRLLQYIYLLLEKEDNGIMPFYIDLSMYEKSIEKGKINEKSNLEQLVQNHFKQIQKIIADYPEFKPIIIVDGVRDFSSGHDRIYSITKRCLSEISCKVVISLDTDFTNNHKFSVHPLSGSDFEYFIRISSMNMFNKDACIRFIKDCLDTFDISLPSDDIDETIIYERLNKLGIIRLDAYWISNLLKEMLGNILNPELTVADLFEVICRRELDDVQINSAAQLAYDYEYGTTDFSNSDFYFDARWKIMRKHRSVLDYLIARYYVLKFEELDLNDLTHVEQQFRFFSMILPKSITVFVAPMINKVDAYESKILEYAEHYYKYLSVLEKNQLIFLLGRLKNKTSIEESKTLLKQYYVDAQKAYFELRGSLLEQKQYAFLLRTISVSLIVLGERNVADQYFDLLLNDKISNEVNRAFHLIYYGDKPYIPSKTRLDLSDDPSEGKQTFKVLCASITNKIKTHKIDNMLMLELFTLCSLIQSRIDTSNIKKVINIAEYGETSIHFLECILSNRKIREYENLRVYFQWMKSELNMYLIQKQKYTHSDIYNTYSNAFTVKRTGWVRRNINEPENIVEHMYNCWLIAALYLPEKLQDYNEYNKQQIMNMLLIHDLGEYKTGDVVRQVKEKQQQYYDEIENEVMQGLLLSGTYPYAQNLSFLSLCWNDWFYVKDINFEIAKDIDNIQAVYQFCKYYSSNEELFDYQDAENWLNEVYELKTNVGKEIAQKLIINNPIFADIIERFGLADEYYE